MKFDLLRSQAFSLCVLRGWNALAGAGQVVPKMWVTKSKPEASPV